MVMAKFRDGWNARLDDLKSICRSKCSELVLSIREPQGSENLVL